MTGYPQENRPAFRQAAAWLRAKGYDVVSPAEIVPPGADTGWEECLRLDLAALVTCEGIALLRGFPQSPGARRELAEALALGLRVYYMLDGEPHYLEDMNAGDEPPPGHYAKHRSSGVD